MDGLNSKKRIPVVLLLADDFNIADINAAGAKDFFKKDRSYLVNTLLMDALSEQNINGDEILKALKSSRKSLFERSQIENGKNKYKIAIFSFKIMNQTYFSVTITPVNNGYYKQESYIDAIINNLPGVVYWKDLSGRYLGCNKFVATMAGFESAEDMIGKTDYDLCWQEFAEDWQLLDRQVVEENRTIVREEKAKLADGRIVTELTYKTPLKNEHGDIIGIIGTSLDITERKRMEEELRQAKIAVEVASEAMIRSEAEEAAARAKAEAEEEMRKTVMVLVGDIVHDLRTPIATVRTAGLILESTLPGIFEVLEEARALGATKLKELNKKKLDSMADNTLTHAIQNSVSMMDDFINSTLKELSNAQKSQQTELTKDDLTKCSSRRILENTLDAYSLNSNVKINQNISYDFFLMGNTIIIMKILFNLIRNSIEQISLNGKGDITISTEAAGDWNLLKIKDTAGGASPDVVSRFFNGYFTTKKNGTGIGLAYCKKMMRNFGGDITCHSVDGESMEFTLSFPKVE